MPKTFAVHSPLETGYVRRVAFAAEIVDAVTLAPVTQGLKVSVTGLKRPPILNTSGFFVWLEEPGLQPQEVVVDASGTAYESATGAPPAPPARSVRIELAPKFGYPFPAGATALRGTLVESRYGPPSPIGGAEVALQWSDEVDWIDAPTISTSGANGDFAALLRLPPDAEPKAHPDGGLTVRLRVERDGLTRISDEFPLRQGAVSAREQPFIWDELAP